MLSEKSNESALYHRADIFDKAYLGNANDVHFYCSYAKRGSRILYLGVGTGRVFSQLAKISKKILGIEKSETMIAACKTKYPHLSSMIKQADAAVIDFGDAKYDLVVAPYSFFPHFDQKRCVAILKKISRSLAPNGKLLTDFFSGFSNPQNRKKEILLNTKNIRQEAVYNHIKKYVVEKTFSGSKHTKACVTQKYFSFFPDDVKNLLLAGGLKKQVLYGNFYKKTLTKRSKIIVVEASK